MLIVFTCVIIAVIQDGCRARKALVMEDAQGTDSLYLISPTELQEELVRLGYNIKVDGNIGTETKRAWDEALCNQHAESFFKGE